MTFKLFEKELHKKIKFLKLLNKLGIISDKHFWTLNFIQLSCDKEKYKLPLHTFKSYLYLLNGRLQDESNFIEKHVYKFYISPLLIEFSVFLFQYMNHIDYYKKPKIKEPELVKLSKKDLL